MSETELRTQPATDPLAELRRRYRDCYQKIAEDDLITPLEANKHMRNIPLLRMIGDVREKKVLDVGSSQGLLMDSLKSADLPVCLDLAGAYMRAARVRGHRVVVADAETLPFQSSCFEVAICSDILEHVLDPEAVVREVERVLKQNGTFFVLLPWDEDLDKYKAFEGTYEFTHLRSFNEQVVRELFRDFRILRRRGVEPKVERPPNLKLLDALPRFVTGLFRLAGVNSVEEWFEQHIPWRIRNRYWKWYWRQLERFPEWDWLWLWFYPPHHIILVLEKHR